MIVIEIVRSTLELPYLLILMLYRAITRLLSDDKGVSQVIAVLLLVGLCIVMSLVVAAVVMDPAFMPKPYTPILP